MPSVYPNLEAPGLQRRMFRMRESLQRTDAAIGQSH